MLKRTLLLALLLFISASYAQTTHSSTGLASYYAKKFEGRKTASGAKYSGNKLTAAHKSLPFGTKVKVTNLKNNKSVIVTVNDRLPKKSKRTIDLSMKAAKELDCISSGTAKVRIEVISP